MVIACAGRQMKERLIALRHLGSGIFKRLL
jgi:hypothetical protein